MCNPVAGAAIMGGAALSQGILDQNANKAQRRFEKQQYAEVRRTANLESFEQYAALQERDVQENAAAVESIKQAGAAAKMARGAVASAASESGVSGNSVSAIIDDVTAGETEYVSSIVRNRVWGKQQLQRQADAVRGETYQKILGALPRTPKSNPLNLLFGTVAGAGQGAMIGASFA